jgi:N-acetylglucosaminyldiphosphoundecaprenol N-acetyl-beta-D-mannosaminyltransferase
MLTLCDRGRALGLRHYFLGGAPGTAELLKTVLERRLPGLDVVGTASPPFRKLTELEDRAIVEAVSAAKPHVVWVGLGSPKQDLWAAEHEGQLESPLILPVGAAFDFHSGRVRRAPRWMRRVGLEWLFRLLMEPRRLVRRYLVTNSLFVALVVQEEWRRRFGGSRT